MNEQPCDVEAVYRVYRTASGSVRGRDIGDGITAVLGIPYAAAPFGVRRFREPQSVPAWTGIRDCTDFGPIAPQSAELPGSPVWRPGDEDVLTLNVWVPEGPGSNARPVFFWIHGGANTFGSSAQPDFDGTALARAGLVVVSCNFRVGFEGFGHVPGFPDNRGLLDQIAGLRWVRQNIAAFGGDPGNVTVAGHSSGGSSAACLMGMKQTRGLFHRVIAHSVPNVFYTVELAAAVTEQVAAQAGVAPTTEGLLSLSPEALVAASDKAAALCMAEPITEVHAFAPVIFQPVVDGEVLPQNPLQAFAAGAAREVDLLACHALEEHWFLHAVGAIREVTTEAELADFAEALQLPPHLFDGYRALMPDAPPLDRYLAVFGDAQFGEYTTRLAEHHVRAGGRAYLARFARKRGKARPWHTADIPFAFGNLDAPGAHFLIGGIPDNHDRALSDRMLQSWADFATTGHPGWPPVTTAATPVKYWMVPVDHLAADDTCLVRALWKDIRFNVLHPSRATTEPRSQADSGCAGSPQDPSS
ncbi:carboxylesterase/lipase family protein [Kitasatospora sp. NPDC058063]|uniref:carboxylesterase/lipase family protein n=1 Tax=unclassified Kitasatospora TaxID=2633591 RepID=UPI0036DD7C85